MKVAIDGVFIDPIVANESNAKIAQQLIIETRCGIRHVVSLSIPLNGFHDSALLGSYVWACFAFNSIEWILAFDAVTEHVNITFNSIEWIQGLTKEYALEHPLHVLSIPLNGFGTL